MKTDTLGYLNALIGFCVNDASWPHPLSDLGYAAHYTEKEISVSLGAVDATVVADLLIGSPNESHAICIEVKSNQVDKNQLQRYLGIKSTDLYDQGLVPSTFDRRTIAHDILYVSSFKNEARIKRRLDSQVPLLTGSTTKYQLRTGKISNPRVDEVLRSGIDVSNRKPPTSYIQFTSDPKYSLRLLQSVLVGLGKVIIAGESFTVRSLAADSIPHWGMIGTQERSTFINAIRWLVTEAALTELNPYIQLANDHNWLCLQGKIDSAAGTMKLSRLLRTHFRRIQSGLAYNPPRPGQLALSGLDLDTDDSPL